MQEDRAIFQYECHYDCQTLPVDIIIKTGPVMFRVFAVSTLFLQN